ncbi:hypothetical protein HUS85_23845 [Pseudomonas protegens]|uniref:hypothetical protein n=1 Tax=Pseudomonas TaxID=286 RepID=UPI001B301B25|nr:MULTISPECIES: hypothetical protein [Pseudomonas]MBP5118882.1 hypothetical protein [Pseudomonas protegens]MDC7818332.1 hypothetical protein [Pseudomonas sp. BLCC-B112]QTU20611.1 hypothetical protein HUT22_21585 [Pseudomonas protegens]
MTGIEEQQHNDDEWFKEERLAWDQYAAAFVAGTASDWSGERQAEFVARFSADFADKMIEERRKRFE